MKSNKIYLHVLILIVLVFVIGCTSSKAPKVIINYQTDNTESNTEDVQEISKSLEENKLVQIPTPLEIETETGCLDENNNGYCDNVETDWKEDYRIVCPQKLLAEKFSFSTGFSSSYFPLAGFYKSNQLPAFCPKGTKAGQNINYHYCEKAIYNAPPETDSKGNILSEAKKIIFSAVVKEITPDDVSVSGKPVQLVEMKCYEYSSDILNECIDENNDGICDTKQRVLKYLKESNKQIQCPQELLKKEYKFPLSGVGSAYYPLSNFYGAEQRTVYCPKGSKAGQNVNYHYCAPFVFDVSPLADEKGDIIEGSKKIFGEAVVKEISAEPDSGTVPDSPMSSAKQLELISLKCYESYYVFNVTEPAKTQTQGGTASNSGVKNPCGYGNCLSNGVCCPSYARYYCEGRCYYSSNDALSASNGRCVNFRTVC